MTHPEQLKPLWSYHAGAGERIWQFQFTDTGDLVGQKRSKANQQPIARFFSIEARTGQLLCDNYLLQDGNPPVPVGESWFTGIETTAGALAICHAAQQGSPEHLGIWAIDFRQPHPCWSRPDLAFVANTPEGLLCSLTTSFAGFPERRFYLVDPRSGALLEQPDDTRANSLRQQAPSEAERQQIALPERTVNQEQHPVVEHTGTATRPLSRQTEGQICETIPVTNGAITVIHRQNNSDGSWTSTIELHHRNHCRYTDTIQHASPFPVTDNFLVRQGILYYCRQDEHLVALALP